MIFLYKKYQIAPATFTPPPPLSPSPFPPSDHPAEANDVIHAVMAVVQRSRVVAAFPDREFSECLIRLRTTIAAVVQARAALVGAGGMPTPMPSPGPYQTGASTASAGKAATTATATAAAPSTTANGMPRRFNFPDSSGASGDRTLTPVEQLSIAETLASVNATLNAPSPRPEIEVSSTPWGAMATGTSTAAAGDDLSEMTWDDASERSSWCSVSGDFPSGSGSAASSGRRRTMSTSNSNGPWVGEQVRLAALADQIGPVQLAILDSIDIVQAAAGEPSSAVRDLMLLVERVKQVRLVRGVAGRGGVVDGADIAFV